MRIQNNSGEEKRTLTIWFEELKERFDGRELNYLSVHKAKITLQLKDNETGEIHLHDLEYVAKDAQNLALKGANDVKRTL